jgi:hypothetical protein
LIPDKPLITVPLPITFVSNTFGARAKMAVQFLLASIMRTVVVAVEPKQSPAQPSKTDPDSGITVNLTGVLCG